MTHVLILSKKDDTVFGDLDMLDIRYLDMPLPWLQMYGLFITFKYLLRGWGI